MLCDTCFVMSSSKSVFYQDCRSCRRSRQVHSMHVKWLEVNRWHPSPAGTSQCYLLDYINREIKSKFKAHCWSYYTCKPCKTQFAHSATLCGNSPRETIFIYWIWAFCAVKLVLYKHYKIWICVKLENCAGKLALRVCFELFIMVVEFALFFTSISKLLDFAWYISCLTAVFKCTIVAFHSLIQTLVVCHLNCLHF